MFMYQKRTARPTELVGQFTSEETDRLTQLQGLFRAYPACYTLDLNVRRLEFARWLQEHGRIGEWRDAQTDPQDGAVVGREEPTAPRQQCA